MAAKHATINVYVGMALSKIWLEGEHVPLVLRRKEKAPSEERGRSSLLVLLSWYTVCGDTQIGDMQI